VLRFNITVLSKCSILFHPFPFFFRYSKAENLTSGSKEMMTFTHLLLEAKSKYSQNLKPYSRTHDILDSVEGFSHINYNYYNFPPITIKTKPMIFILRRKEAYDDDKLKHIEKEAEVLPRGTEKLPVQTSILQSDVEQEWGEIDDVLELDETLEPPDELPELSSDINDYDYKAVFVKPIIEDNEEYVQQESPFIDLDIEPTEDIEEEVQLSKLMRMSKEDLIKELKRAENKAKIHPKSRTVRRNIKKIIREYKALENGKQVKEEESTHADLPSGEDVKRGDYVQLQVPQFPKVSEENDSETHAQGEQVAKKPVTEKYKMTDLQQNTDHAALPAQTETAVSSLSFDNLTNEEHDQSKVDKGKKTIKKIIKKYKILDQNIDEEPLIVANNITADITVQRKKSTQKIRPAKQKLKTEVVEEGTEDLETIREPQEMPVPTETQPTQKEKTEVKDGKKIKKVTNNIISETNGASVLDNDIKASDRNLNDSENGTTESKALPQISKHKVRKAGNKVVKETVEGSNAAEMSVAEELQETPLPSEKTPTSKTRRKSDERKTNKEKFKDTDGIQNTHVPSEHKSNTDDADKLNAAEAYEQDNETPVLDDWDIALESKIQEIAAEKLIPVKNEIEMQDGEKVSDVINPDTHAQYHVHHPEKTLFGVSMGPEGLSPTQISTVLDDKNMPISESSEDKISKQKAASQNTETIQPVLQDESRIENDKKVQYDDVATRKEREEVTQI
jgi:alpha-1,6-mannosyltransferase